MREALERPDEMARLGERARTDVLERFSVERAAAFIAERVARIHREGGVARAAGAALAPPASRPQVIARRGLLRAMGPYLRRRAEFDVALVQSDEEAGQRLDLLDERIARAERRLDEDLARLETRASQTEQEVAGIRASLRAVPYMSDPRILATETADGRPAIEPSETRDRRPS